MTSQRRKIAVGIHTHTAVTSRKECVRQRGTESFDVTNRKDSVLQREISDLTNRKNTGRPRDKVTSQTGKRRETEKPVMQQTGKRKL